MTATLPSYDEIPYASFPISETHPDRLAVIARLFGLRAPDPKTARILELGCAAGGNLLPIAWFLPETQAVGIELSRAQAELGQERIRALGVGNIEIRHQDILDLPLDGPPFDYIIAHGVYSWVPPPVQKHILRLCAARLSPNGIAYISYNTRPGGHLRAMLREMLLYHTRGLDEPRERLSAAREFLEFLATPTAHIPPGHTDLQEQIERLRKARDSYLYHEYLVEQNEALLFSEFNARTEAAGLQFLAESQLHTLFSSTLGPQAAERLEQFSGLIEEEQYGDFLRLRPFRQTLLCRAAVHLEREIDLEQLFTLPLYSDLSTGAQRKFQNASGQTFVIDTPAAREFVKALGSQFPVALNMADALALARAADRTNRQSRRAQTQAPAQAQANVSEFFNLFVSGALQPSLLPPNPTTWRTQSMRERDERSSGAIPGTTQRSEASSDAGSGTGSGMSFGAVSATGSATDTAMDTVPDTAAGAAQGFGATPNYVLDSIPATSMACPLARYLVTQGETLIPTPRHQTLQLDPLSVQMLLLLDGQGTLEAHLQTLDAWVSSNAEGLPLHLSTSKPEARAAKLKMHFAQFQQLLRRHGLLHPVP